MTPAEQVEEILREKDDKCRYCGGSGWDDNSTSLTAEGQKCTDCDNTGKDQRVVACLARIDGLEAENEELRKRAEEAEGQIRRIHKYSHKQEVCGSPMLVRACDTDPCSICRRVIGGEG